MSYLYNSLRLYFDNGGQDCYIVSVGTFNSSVLKVNKDELIGTNGGGLKVLETVSEPAIIVIPDAILLGEQAHEVYTKMLEHCKKMGNRFAIVDVVNGFESLTNDQNDVVERFRAGIGTENLSYGAVYYPWLHSEVINRDLLSFEYLSEEVDLLKLLTESQASQSIQDYHKLTKPSTNDKASLHQQLLAKSSTYVQVIDEIQTLLNILPPSSALAGIYAKTDLNQGVWKAPANVALMSVNSPCVQISNGQQEPLNIDIQSGKSVNAIRYFVGRGTLVWGARTIEGNSLDWRYINVRRTILMISASIECALKSYVFEPNTATTWQNVNYSLSNFLNDLWQQGALTGSKSSEAYSVAVGLGTTMAAQDVLEGQMIVRVSLALISPAEYMTLTFHQRINQV